MEIPHIGECFDRCGAKKNNDNSLKMIPAIKSPCFSYVPYRKKDAYNKNFLLSRDSLGLHAS